MSNTTRYWYATKRHRWSCRLAQTWEGWLVDAAWLVTFFGIFPWVQERRHPLQSLGLVFGLIAIFMATWKGEPQRWED